MDRKQEIIWTVLPNGIKDNQYHFSVFITPRLSVSNGNVRIDKLKNYDQLIYTENSISKCWIDRLKELKDLKDLEELEELKCKLLVNNKEIDIIINKQNFDFNIWTKLFDPDTPVKPYVFDDLSKRNIRSYPVNNMLDYMMKKYRDIATASPDKLPQLQAERDENGNPMNGKATLESLIDEMAGIFYRKDIIFEFKQDTSIDKEAISIFNPDDSINYDFINPILNEAKLKAQPNGIKKHDGNSLIIKTQDAANLQECYLEQIGDMVIIYSYVNRYSIIDSELKNYKVIEPGKDCGLSDEAFGILQAYRFFDRDKIGIDSKFPPKLPEFDFHLMHSLLGDFPVLMKKLGFVVDFTIPVLDIQLPKVESGHNKYSVKLALPIPSANAGDIVEYILPETMCDFYSKNGRTIDGLFAASNDFSKVSNGYLNLKEDSFDVVQVDPDGAMLKIIHATQNMKWQLARKYICTIKDKEPTKQCEISHEDISKIIKDYNDEKDEEINNFKNELQNEVSEAYKTGEYNKVVKLQEELSKLTKIFIYAGSKIEWLKPNRWQVTTGNYIYEIEQVKPGTYHFYAVTKVAIDTTTDAGLPALQSAGIGVVQSKRAWDIHQNLEQTSLIINNPAGTTFYAEDILRGYRVDILTNDETFWRSLCGREGSYFLRKSNSDTEFSVTDEGYVKGASASSEAPGRDLYLHELLFAWNGWSMVAERPGKTIVTEEKNKIVNEKPGQVETKMHEKFGLLTKFKPVSGGLPHLRFGYDYLIRVRTVDLAGNGLLHGDESKEFTEPITYRRFEPLAAPTLYPPRRFKHGEAAERMIIRTFNENDNNLNSTEEDLRHVVPPKISQIMAETHGMFDQLIKDGKLEDAFTLAARSSGMLNTTDPLASKNQIESSIPDNTDSAQIIIKAEQISLPYLPDVLAKGVLLRNVLGAKNVFGTGIEYVSQVGGLKIPFYDENKGWPEALSFRIGIMEGFEGTGPKWDSNSRILTIFLPKAQQHKILYSCYFGEEDLRLMGIWNWIHRPNNKLKKFAENGCHWMMTPFRELSLVHAVQKPLQKPLIKSIIGKKEIYHTFAEIQATFDIHSKSTGKITLLARWSDPVDYPEQPEPSTEDNNAIAFEMVIDENESNKKILPVTSCSSHKHEFGNTHFHRVKYHLNATSRFTDCFDTSGSALNFSTEGPDVCEVKILNSARPESPKVKYIIPTFLWEIETKEIKELITNKILGYKLIRNRLGGGLRVYMDRPWYSSGDDELLAVVLPHSISHELLKPYITQWGQDPVHISLKTTNFLTAKNFVDKTETGNELGLSIEEIENEFVDVAAYKPVFDKEKKLWYCDIRLQSSIIKSYFPFIQLKLARYQPYSVKDSHLSRVVKTDFIQLPNDRNLIVELTNNLFTKIELSGYGPGENLLIAKKKNRVEVTIEKNINKKDLEWVEIEVEAKINNLEQKEKTNKIELVLDQTTNDYHYKWTLEQPATVLPIQKADPGKYRIIIKEFEIYKSDSQNEKPLSEKTFAERMVYSDLIEFRVVDRTGIIKLL